MNAACESCGGDGIQCNTDTHDCGPCVTCGGSGEYFPRLVGIDMTYPDWTVHAECWEEAPGDYQRCKPQGVTVLKPTAEMNEAQLRALHAALTSPARELTMVAMKAEVRKNLVPELRPFVKPASPTPWGKGANHV